MATRPVATPRTRNNKGWVWGFVLALAAVLFLGWWWVGRDADTPHERDVDEVSALTPTEEQPMRTEQQAEPGTMEGAEMEAQGPQAMLLPVIALSERPEQFVGRTVRGQAEVASVPSQAGFWIQEGGQKLFVLIDPQSADMPKIGEKMAVALDNATVQRTDTLGEQLAELDPKTQQIVEDQEHVLIVDGADIRTGTPQTGTPQTSTPQTGTPQTGTPQTTRGSAGQ